MTTISEEYREQNALLHEQKTWGTGGVRWVGLVAGLMAQFQIRSILDYGCGRGTLLGNLTDYFHQMGLRLEDGLEYDPAIPGKGEIPNKTFGMVVCTDVLEHVELAHLRSTLVLLSNLTEKVLLLSVCTQSSNKNLPDGTNTHLVVEPQDWWRGYIQGVGGWERVVSVPREAKSKDAIFICLKEGADA